MTSIAVKMRCYHAKMQSEGTGEAVGMSVVYSTDPTQENYIGAVATALGSCQLLITNQDAQGFFKAGKEYLIMFTEA